MTLSDHLKSSIYEFRWAIYALGWMWVSLGCAAFAGVVIWPEIAIPLGLHGAVDFIFGLLHLTLCSKAENWNQK